MGGVGGQELSQSASMEEDAGRRAPCCVRRLRAARGEEDGDHERAQRENRQARRSRPARVRK
jgi:hypothetical protein